MSLLVTLPALQQMTLGTERIDIKDIKVEAAAAFYLFPFVDTPLNTLD